VRLRALVLALGGTEEKRSEEGGVRKRSALLGLIKGRPAARGGGRDKTLYISYLPWGKGSLPFLTAREDRYYTGRGKIKDGRHIFLSIPSEEKEKRENKVIPPSA